MKGLHNSAIGQARQDPGDMAGMEPPYNRHYVALDAQGRIVDGWGNGPHPGRDTSGAMCVTGEGGCRLRSFPGGEGPRYKLL